MKLIFSSPVATADFSKFGDHFEHSTVTAEPRGQYEKATVEPGAKEQQWAILLVMSIFKILMFG